MDNKYFSDLPDSLTSIVNDQKIGRNIAIWQSANAFNLEHNIMFAPEERAQYLELSAQLAQCFIAFLGCNAIAAYLPQSQEEFELKIQEQGQLGLVCLWQMHPAFIDLIAERMISLRSKESNVTQNPAKFNPFDLVTLKIPYQEMGQSYAVKPWMCEENIAQIRNQDFDSQSLLVTALVNTTKSGDTAAELVKIRESDLFVDLFVKDTALIRSFAEKYGIDLDATNSFSLEDQDKKILSAFLRALVKDYGCELYTFANYVSMLLINYQRNSFKDERNSPLIYALGQSLQALSLPRYSRAFISSSGQYERRDVLAKKLESINKSKIELIDRLKQDKASLEAAFNKILEENKEASIEQKGWLDHASKQIGVSVASEVANDQAQSSVINDGNAQAYATQNSALQFDSTENQLVQSGATNSEVLTHGKVVDAALSDSTAVALMSKTSEDQNLYKPYFLPCELDAIRDFLGAANLIGEQFDRVYLQLSFIDWYDKLERLLDTNDVKASRKLSERTKKFFNKYDQKLTQNNGDVNQEPSLSEDDLVAIDLTNTKAKDLSDNERLQVENFFDKHRNELREDPKLYMDWESFLSIVNVECSDFLVGLSQVLLNLNSEQAEIVKITVALQNSKSPTTFAAEHNYEACAYFSIMYAPLLRRLTSSFKCFEFDDKCRGQTPSLLLDFCEYVKQHQIKECTKISSTALQLKFKIKVELQSDTSHTKKEGSLVWEMKKTDIGFKLTHDLMLIDRAKAPLRSMFLRNILSEQDAYENLSLDNVCGFISDCSLQAGAFIADNIPGCSTSSRKLNKTSLVDNSESPSLLELFQNECATSDDDVYAFIYDTDETDNEALSELNQLFSNFCNLYTSAINSMLHCNLKFEQVHELFYQYSLLQLQILQKDIDDYKRQKLLEIVQSIGLAYDCRNSPYGTVDYAVATPYHVHSMYNHMLSIERVFNLVHTMLSSRLFIASPNHLIQSAWNQVRNVFAGPEVVVSKYRNEKDMPFGCASGEKYLLKAEQSRLGYTLYKSVNSLPNVDEYTDIAVHYLEGRVKSLSGLSNSLNVLIFDCDNLDIIRSLYKKLDSKQNNAFKQIRVNLCLVNENGRTLSYDYQLFAQQDSDESLDSLQQENNSNVRLQFLSWDKFDKSEKLSDIFLYPSENTQNNKRAFYHTFDAALLFNFSSSKSAFDFTCHNIPVVKQETELFHTNINFATTINKTSQLFLVRAEQNLGGMAYLNALYFLLTHSNESQTVETLIDKIQPLCSLTKDGGVCVDQGSETCCISTPVPSSTILLTKSDNIGAKLTKIHEWSQEVLCIDPLFTSQQFSNLQVFLFKYYQSEHSNTNVFISMAKPRYFENLESLVHDELRLGSDIITLNVYKYALEVSGGLLMHSLLNKTCTQEMLGLVLSKYIAELTLAEYMGMPLKEARNNTAFFSLDDYASSFGSTSGNIADLLVLCVLRQANGRYLLYILIVESKFYQDVLTKALKTSLQQTKATADSFFALLGVDNAMCTIDRQYRLRKLCAMLADHKIMSSIQSPLQFQQDLITGRIDVALGAMSCVFGYKDAHENGGLSVRAFEFGSTQNNMLNVAPKGVQLIFREKATLSLLNEFLVDPDKKGGAFKPCFAQHPLFAPFRELELMVKPLVLSLDAAASEKYKRKNNSLLNYQISSKSAQRPEHSIEQRKSSLATEVEAPSKSNVDAQVNPCSVSLISEEVTNTPEPILIATPSGQSELFVEDNASFNHADTLQDVDAKVPDTSKAQDTQIATSDEHTVSSSQDNEPTINQSESKQPEIKQPERMQPETKQAHKRTLRKHRHSIFDELEKTEVIQPTAPKPEQETSLEDNSELSAQEQQLLNQFFEQHPDFAQLVQDTPDVYKAEIEQRTLWAEEMQSKLIKAFEALNMRPEIIRYHLTPNGAVFSFKGNEKFVRTKIERDREYLKTTYSLNIGQVNAKVGSIDISVQNDTADRIKVPYLSICRRRSLNIEHLSEDDGALEGFNSKILLGLLEDSGKFAYLDLKKAAPHTLIGGGTGSGKSNVLNIMLLDLALTNSPNDLRLVLMDPKGGAELGIFEHLPHVEQFIKTKEEAADTLETLAKLMDKRFDTFKAKEEKLGSFVKIPDLVIYNQKVSKEERLPRVVVVIDEFADWFIDKSFREAANTIITRIGAKARAAGLHLILATQRPDNDVVDTKLRNNLGNQIALKTRDLNNSAIILGNRDHDASRLLGKGHMLCSFEGYKSVFCAQAAFIDNDALGKALEAICNDWYRLDSMDE